jgi:cytochrome c556
LTPIFISNQPEAKFMSRPHVVILLLTAVSLAACGMPVEDTRPGQPVKTRQVAFKEILRVFEPMGTMLRTHQYTPEKFAQYAQELMGKRDSPWGHFGTDTNYPPTKAKAEVWSEMDRFERERDDFIKATDELLAAAQAKQQAKAETAYYKVYDLCQSCHKHFKEK